MAEFPVTITMTEEEARAFVDDLADDADFRARLEADPHGELARRGIYVPPENVPERVTLPPPEVLQGLRDRVKEIAAEGFSFIWMFPFFSFIWLKSFGAESFGGLHTLSFRDFEGEDESDDQPEDE